MPYHPRCQATTKTGLACKAVALSGKRLCAFHDPDTAEACQEARKRGGKARRKPATVLPDDAEAIDLSTVAGVVAVLARTIREVRQGEIAPKTANAIGCLASVLLRAIEAASLEKAIEEQARVLLELRKQMNGMQREQPPPSAEA